MRRELSRRFRWAASALLAVSLAAMALCSLALAQTPPATAQPPAGITAEQQRVVAAVKGVGCIPLDQANNTMAPPRLFGGVVQCLASGDYDKAARLSALAGIYLHFDVARVSDRTAGGVAGALPMLATSGASAGQKEGFEQGLHKLKNDPAQLQAVCNEVERIGMPSYYPTYMIAGGMGAFIGKPKGGPLKQNFDAPGTWSKLQASYLQCPAAQGFKQRIENELTKFKGLLDKIPGVHMNDVAEKITELHDPDSGEVPFNPAFSPDGRLLAVLSSDRIDKVRLHKVHILDWRKHQLMHSLDLSDVMAPASKHQPVQFSLDGRFIASCGDSGYLFAVRVWSSVTWEVIKNIAAKSTRFNGCDAITFSADSRVLLRVNAEVPHESDDMFAYSTDTWQTLWSLHDERVWPQHMAASPVGSVIAVAGLQYSLKWGTPGGHDIPVVGLLDLQQRRYVRFLELGLPQNEPVDSLSWSPDGTRLAVAAGGNLDVFDVRSGQLLAHQLAGESSHMAVSYTPNGRYLVVSSFTGRGTGFGVQIWDGQDNRLIQHIPGNAAGIAISRDSRYLAVAKRGHIEIWQFKQSGSEGAGQQ